MTPRPRTGPLRFGAESAGLYLDAEHVAVYMRCLDLMPDDEMRTLLELSVRAHNRDHAVSRLELAVGRTSCE